MIFGEYSDIVENDNLSVQTFLDVSRFLYSGVGRYASSFVFTPRLQLVRTEAQGKCTRTQATQARLLLKGLSTSVSVNKRNGGFFARCRSRILPIA